ncbi:MAG TPA: hypothetical protein VHP58_06045 [Alphaproteobacteria bacterium]|nr:hypothetical protein [Alphaproteobacteria bacterium]
MNQMQPTPMKQVTQNLDEARATCRELMDVLRHENDLVAHAPRADVSILEDQLQLKRHLTLRLERLVHGLKSIKDQWENDRGSAEAARRLANEMGEFHRVAARNMMQLKAAHQIRADVIALLKDTYDSQQTPLGYAKDGSLQRGDSASVMRKEI